MCGNTDVIEGTWQVYYFHGSSEGKRDFKGIVCDTFEICVQAKGHQCVPEQVT